MESLEERMKRWEVATNSNPYQGLKHIDNTLTETISGVATNSNPYQGLKQS